MTGRLIRVFDHRPGLQGRFMLWFGLIVLALMAGSHGPLPVPSPSPFDEWARGRRP